MGSHWSQPPPGPAEQVKSGSQTTLWSGTPSTWPPWTVPTDAAWRSWPTACRCLVEPSWPSIPPLCQRSAQTGHHGGLLTGARRLLRTMPEDVAYPEHSGAGGRVRMGVSADEGGRRLDQMPLPQLTRKLGQHGCADGLRLYPTHFKTHTMHCFDQTGDVFKSFDTNGQKPKGDGSPTGVLALLGRRRIHQHPLQKFKCMVGGGRRRQCSRGLALAQRTRFRRRSRTQPKRNRAAESRMVLWRGPADCANVKHKLRRPTWIIIVTVLIHQSDFNTLVE